MVFQPPSWVPALPGTSCRVKLFQNIRPQNQQHGEKRPANTGPPCPEIPDSVPLSEFMYDERYGRWSTSKARNPYTCGVTGKTYTSKQIPERIDLLSRAIAKRLGFSPNEGTEWDRVVAVYSVNTVRCFFTGTDKLSLG